MDFITSNLFSYIFASAVIIYIIIDFIKKELFLYIKEKIFIRYIFTYSIFIFYFIAKIDNFDIATFLLSLPFGLLSAIILNCIVSRCRIVVLEKQTTLNNKNENLIFKIFKIFFWLSILCVITTFSILLYAFIFKIYLSFNPFLPLIIPLILTTFYLILAISAKFIYYGHYVFIGKAKASDENIIKRKLEKENIDFKIESASSVNLENQIIRILIEEKQEHKARILLDSLIISRSWRTPF